MTGTARRVVFVAANASIDRLHEVERLEVAGINRPERVLAVPGGKGLNAARSAVALGGRATLVALVGRHGGEWIADRLAAAGVEAKLITTTAETRVCLSVLDRSTGRLTEFYEPGEPLEPGAWERLEAAIVAELERGDVAAVAMSGSLPPGAPADGYGSIVRQAAAHAVSTIVDTHGPALAAAIAARAGVVKINVDEAVEVAGGDGTATEAQGGPGGAASHQERGAVGAARAIQRRGAGAVVVTLGSAGAVGVEADAVWRLQPTETRGPYSVGSGDAFLAALAIGLARGEVLADAARLGMAAGIANAFTPGAGVLDPALARRLLENIRIEPA